MNDDEWNSILGETSEDYSTLEKEWGWGRQIWGDLLTVKSLRERVSPFPHLRDETERVLSLVPELEDEAERQLCRGYLEMVFYRAESGWVRERDLDDCGIKTQVMSETALRSWKINPPDPYETEVIYILNYSFDSYKMARDKGWTHGMNPDLFYIPTCLLSPEQIEIMLGSNSV